MYHARSPLKLSVFLVYLLPRDHLIFSCCYLDLCRLKCQPIGKTKPFMQMGTNMAAVKKQKHLSLSSAIETK